MVEQVSCITKFEIGDGETIVEDNGKPYLCWHDLIDIRVPLFNDPSILLTKRVPLPLHFQNPRTILNKIDNKWWDRTRKRVYASSLNKCRCCGVSKYSQIGYPKNIDAHELYNIDYQTGRVTLNSIVPLCSSGCHKAIHYGRWSAQLDSGKITEQEFYKVIGYANKILAENNLPEKDWDATKDDNIYNVPWDQWYLELEINGKVEKFYSLYKNEEDLRKHYE